MKYEKTDRIQDEDYYSNVDFLNDVIETLLDESNYEKTISIFADKEIISEICETMKNADINQFEFDFQTEEINENFNGIGMITLYEDGAIFVDSATDKNNNFYECDGFLFVHKDVDKEAIQGRNRRCDVMVFDIN